MADNSGEIIQAISDAQTSNTSSLTNAAHFVSSAVDAANDRITDAINNLGEGLKLTDKKDSGKDSGKDTPKETLESKLAKLKDQLKGLEIFSPELAEIANTLISINTELLGATTKTEAESEENKEDTGPEINVDAKEPKDLAGLTNLVAVTGTGLSIVSNYLSGISEDLAELKLKILEGASSDSDMKATEFRDVNKVTGDEAKKNAKKDEAGESKGKLAQFFQGISGPLESIAGSLLLIAVALSILQQLQINSEMIATVIGLMTFMTILFFALSFISGLFDSFGYLLDTQGEQSGSILNIVKMFAAMLFTTVAVMLISAILVTILKEKAVEVLVGMLVIFASLFVSLLAVSAMAAIMKNLVDEKSPIMQLVKGFAYMIGAIVVLALICFLLHEQIETGLGYATSILKSVVGLMLGLGVVLAVLSGTGLTPEVLNGFKNILITTIVLIGVLAILTIILGFIDPAIIERGTIAVGLLVGMVIALVGMLTIAIRGISKVSEEQLWAVMGILIVTTVMIAVLSLLVIVLGNQDTAVISQGIITIGLLMTIPFLIIKVMSKLGQKMAQMAQALIGIAMAGVLSIALAAVGFVIVSLFANFTAAQVLTAMLAVTLTTALLIVVGVAAVGLAAAAPAVATAVPFALLGIAMAGVLAVAIAAVGRLLATVLEPEVAKAAILAATAVMLTTMALVVVASGAITLAGLAIPLALYSGMALLAIEIVGVLLAGIAIVITGPILIASLILESVDFETIDNGIKAIKGIIKVFVGMLAVVAAFALIGAALVANLAIAAYILVGLGVTLAIFVMALTATANWCNLIPEELNLKKVSDAIKELNSFSKSINAFEAPSLAKLVAADFAMGFVAKFAKKLGKLGDDGTVAKVQNLANSIAELASQASGMQELASAIDAVAKATEGLNEVNSRSAISAEALSGQSLDQANMLQEIKETPKEENKPNEQLAKILEAITNLVGEMQAIKSNLGVIAMSAENTNKFEKKASVSSEFGMQDI